MGVIIQQVIQAITTLDVVDWVFLGFSALCVAVSIKIAIVNSKLE